jgi:hypothetical protein
MKEVSPPARDPPNEGEVQRMRGRSANINALEPKKTERSANATRMRGRSANTTALDRRRRGGRGAKNNPLEPNKTGRSAK